MARWISQGSMYLLGLIFLVFGINGLMTFTMGQGFIPMPPPPENMIVVFNGFMATGYLMIVVKAIEVIAGLLLIAQKFLNLAVVLLGPIVFNILAIHIFAAPDGLVMGIAITVLWGITLMSRWKDLKVILKA